MKKLTVKEVEDKIIARLKDGTGPARYVVGRGVGSGCVYRTADGRGCAVGCLIPDNLYDPIIEGTAVQRLQLDADNKMIANVAASGSRADLDGALADILNQIVEPSGRILIVLTEWQRRHDNPRNWNGVVYRGLLDRVG